MPQQQGSMSEAKPSQRFHSLNAEQVEVLHQVLSDVVPIHGRGNFPTLELRPRDIIIAVRARLQKQGIQVRDVRLNGSTASHVLVRDNGTSYKDLDIIFGVELPSQEEFQVIKEAVLGCLLDCLPTGVNKERISSATMKEAYVQKMVKVFNEHDRWSLISLSNNSGKNLELKFVSSLRRQFEFSVDSFQIILDRLLESYMAQDLQRKTEGIVLKELPGDDQKKQAGSSLKQKTGMEKPSQTSQVTDKVQEKESQTEVSLQHGAPDEIKDTKFQKKEKHDRKTPVELKDITEASENVIPGPEKSSNEVSEQRSETEETKSVVLDTSECQKMAEHSVQICPGDDREALCSKQELCVQGEPSKHSKEAEITKQKGQFELPEISDKSGCDLAQESAGNGHSDEGKCSEQERKEDEKATSATTEASISSNAKAEPHTPAADESSAVESETGENVRTEEQDDSQENEMNEASLASEEQLKDAASSTDFQATDLTDTLEIPRTLLTESAEKTQDTLPAPPGLLLIDKKTSKASERLSYMVVLKHSSPKPPRRMCRKVSPTTSQQSETVPTTPSTDPSPCPSPDPEEALKTDENLLNLDKTDNPTTSAKTEPNVDLNLSATDVTPLDESEKTSPDIPAPPVDQQTEPTAITASENASAMIQSDPPDLSTPDDAEIQISIENTSAVVLSDAVTLQEIKIDVDEAKTVPLDPQCATPPVSCLAPPVLSFSAPCFTPSPPSLSPPPCLTPPSQCMSTVSPSTSFSSAPLSFSPTSSCLSSPPYLTPPMLSLSPPPLCLSPPLLCLTPPVDSADLVAQVSAGADMPLILDTDSSEQHLKEPATQQVGVPLLDTAAEKEVDYISTSPQGSKPVSFPITIPTTTSSVLPQSTDPGESAAPNADSAPNVTQESKTPIRDIMPESAQNPIGCAPDVEVLAESMYGDFEAAMDHLRYRLIATRNPEEIRGGGLLKYSNLLVRDYRPASETQIKTLERYMCSRFFIDFPDVQEQQRKILSYLKNHFIGEERSKYQYLMTLRRVVDDSTVCLMGHERRQTLNMITVLALKVLGEQNIIPNTDHVTCFYQPAPYIAEHSAPYIPEPSYCSYYIPQGGSALLYQPYPLHLHSQTGLV